MLRRIIAAATAAAVVLTMAMAAAPSGIPGEPAGEADAAPAHAAKKKKPKRGSKGKKRKRGKKRSNTKLRPRCKPVAYRDCDNPTRRWYRLSIDATGTLRHESRASDGGSRIDSRTGHWSAESGVAFVVFKQPALQGPGGPAPSRPDAYSFSVGVQGMLDSATNTMNATPPAGSSCSPLSDSWTLTAPTHLYGRVGGALAADYTVFNVNMSKGLDRGATRYGSSGMTCTLVGGGTVDTLKSQSKDLLGPPPGQPLICGRLGDQEVELNLVGGVAFGDKFTLSGSCRKLESSATSTTSTELTYALTFTPCPNRGLDIQHCG